MQLPNSAVKLLSLAILVVPAVTALDCVNEVDHKKEYTTNGKVYKLYCNSEIKPLTPAERINNVATPEECADLCAKKSDCRHAFYAAKNKICFLRPPQTSIGEKSFQNMVASIGNTWGWIYDREAPAETGNAGGNTGGNAGGNTGGNAGGNTGGSAGGNTGGDAGGNTGGNPGSGTGSGDVTPPSSSGNQAEYDCTNSRDHKKLFSINGRTFELLCGYANPSPGYQTIPNVNSLRACAEKCALDSKCANAEYHISSGVCELEADDNPMVIAGYHLWVPKLCPNTPRAQKPVANPPQTTDLSCPMNDGHIYEGVDGTWYYIQCCSDSSAAVVTGFAQAKNHKDCVDKCSLDEKCSSVSFETTGVNNCKFYGPGDYSTVHKPGVHHHYATSPPTSAPDHFGSKRCSTACPEADGQIFASPTGENFVMSCKKRHGTTYLKDVPDRYPSFASCMTACGAVPACQSVDYEAKTNNCYFSTNSKSPTIAAKAFMSAHSAGCSGACAGCADDSCKDLEKGPLGPRKYGCPANHGKPITVNGVDFQVACQHAINSHPYTQVTAESYEKCIELCAANANCGGVNWIGKTCYHHPDNNADESSAFVHQRADSDAYVKIPGHLYSSLSQAA